jgi:choice-of-anchor B domain-containing protein
MPARPSVLKLFAIWFFLPASTVFSRPNFNIDSLSFNSISGTEGCWGYVDSATSREYALICAQTRLEVWNVTDPYNPVLATSVPATGTDLKQVRTHSSYALAVNQNSVGLQVIELTVPENAATIASYRTTSDDGGAHTVHIDGRYAYLGMNGNSPYSWRIIDISNLLAPVQVGEYMTSQPSGSYRQSHDGYAKGDTAYVAFLSSGFSIVDIRAKGYPRRISDVLYPGAFTHNCWPTEDHRHLFTTDEVANGHLRIWDIRDAANPVQVAEWKPPGIPSIIHNVQVKGIYAYISYYSDGVVILDVEDPTQPVEVGHYDTAPQAAPSGQYAGCWDFFPYFPSGTLLASNYSSPPGMWLLHFNGARAGRIGGTVVDFFSNQPVADALVRNLDVPRQSRSDSAGNFSLRTDSGSFLLEFSRADYIPETLAVAGRLNDTTDLGTIRLKPTSILPSVPSGFVARPDQAGNILLSWERPPDSGLAGFLLYRTAPSDSLNFFPLDSIGAKESTYVDVGANPGERFTYRMATVNAAGYTSSLSPPVKAMRFLFGSKLLLVDRTAYCSPYLKRYTIAPDSFYNFHARLLRRFDFDTIGFNDCTVRLAVNPAFVSRHPVIVLHSSEFFTDPPNDNASFLSFFTEYLKIGGKLILAGHSPPFQAASVNLCGYNGTFLPNANPVIWDSVRSAFGFDCLYYPPVHYVNNSILYQSFAAARSMDSLYPHLAVDSLRVDYFVPTTSGFSSYPYPTLPNVGYFTSRDSSEIPYTFGSTYGGDLKRGQAVAKKHLDPATGGGFIWFNFPLYYMKEDSVKKAFSQALSDLGVSENFPKADINRDGMRNITDAAYLLNWVFLGEQFSIFDADEADLNCDKRSSPVDVILLLLNVFPGQPLPCN